MIKLSILFPSLALVFSSVRAMTRESTLSDFKMMPFYLDGSKTVISYKPSILGKSGLIVEIYIINELYPDGKLIVNKSHSTSTAVTYNYDNRYTMPSGNQIQVKYGMIGTNRKATITKDIEVSNNSASILVDDSVYTYTSKSKIYIWENKIWTENYQEIEFYNFENTYVPDYYHNLNLDNFYFKNLSVFPSSLAFETGYLRVTNRNGVFNSLPTSGSYAMLPLKLTKTNDTYHLAFKETYYVDPITLEMSSQKKDGYVKTPFLYFPRNEKRYEEEYQCTIVLDNLGIDGSKFLTNFKYKSLLNIIGDCHNSKYCVVSK